MNHRDLFLFCLTCFVALTITNPGLFLNDEWMSAAQITQIGQGQQAIYNEGSFGYFANGTIGTYMESRNNVLMYSLALPLLALPLFLAVSNFANPMMFLSLVWTVFGILTIATAPSRVGPYRLRLITVMLVVGLLSAIICPAVGGDARAVIALVLTNLLVYGGFAVLVARTLDRLVAPDLHGYCWLVTLACSTLLFWAGTGKDHMMVAFLVLACGYGMIRYWQTQSSLILAALCAGLLVWVRTEVGVFVLLAFLLLILAYRAPARDLIAGIGAAGCGIIPFFVNNWVVSGNLLTPPFLMANAAKYTGTVVSHTAMVTAVFHNPVAYLNPVDGLQLLLMPASGALGLIAFGVAIIAGAAWIRDRRPPIGRELITLLVLGGASFVYYLLFCGFLLHLDTGIVPDIRYATAAYAPVTIAALSLLTRLGHIDPLREVRTGAVAFLVAVPTILVLLLVVPLFGASYPQFTHLINLLLVTVMVITLGRPGTYGTGVTLVAVLLLIWQLGMVFVYGDIKINGYPYLPIVDWLHTLLFRWS